MRFNFVGEISVNSQDAKVPGFREIKGKADGVSMNLICIAAKNNRAFMECAGFKNSKIKTYDTEKNAIEIDWDDRDSVEVVKQVANYKKNVIVLDGERYEFITTYDFINFIREHIDEIKGKEFTVTGQVQKHEYNGTISDRFQIQNMFEVTEEKKRQLKVYGEFYFNADGIDLADWKSEKQIHFNGYTREYMDKQHPNAMVTKTITFDCSKVDFDNEKHMDAVQLRLEMMGMAYEDGKISVNLKKNTYYVQNVVLSYINGAEVIEFSEDQLTETQKRMVRAGMKKVDDFRPAGQIYGERVQAYRLVDFDLRDKYADGLVKCDETAKEFEDMIYVSADNKETEGNFINMNPPEDDDDLNLFDN